MTAAMARPDLSATGAADPHLRLALVMIAGFACARALSALMFTGFGIDESYTVAMSRSLALSYFDHPPLHQWITHFTLLLTGANPAVRLPFVLISAGTAWVLYRMTRRAFGGVAGLWALFGLNVSVYFHVVSGSWVSPDGVLIFCMAAAADAASAILFADPQGRAKVWRGWLGFGVWMGLAGLSKYLAVFLPFGLLAFLLLSRRHRHWLAHPAPWAGVLLALLIVAPVLVWNAQNHWASFAFQAGRAVPVSGVRLTRVATMTFGQIVYLSPLIFPVLVAAVVGALARSGADDARRLLLWLSLPMIVVMTCTPLWGSSGFPHWTMPGWFFTFALFGDWMAGRHGAARWPRLWAISAAGLTLSLSLLFASLPSSDWLRRALPGLLTASDPMTDTLGWQPIRTAPAFQATPDWTPAFVLAHNWIEGGKVDLAVGASLPVFVFSQDPRGFAFRTNPADKIGTDALIVVQAAAAEDLTATLRPYFETLDPPETLRFGRSGRAEIDLRLIRAHHLLRAYALPYGPWRLPPSP